MITIKNKQALMKMRAGGALLAQIMEEVLGHVAPGVTTASLDAIAERAMHAVGLVPACKGYHGYKHATCISRNDVVVHGVPSEGHVIQPGDIVSVDMVGIYKGYHLDMARTVVVPGAEHNETHQKLIVVAQEALDAGLAIVRPGVALNEVSCAIQSVVEKAGFGVLRDFVGHGIGKAMHEDPQVPNFDTNEPGPKLQQGMTLAIEPMITTRSPKIKILSDGWSVQTVDGGWAAHVEDTVAVTADGVDIFTRL
jgi:methionyl aminopeptidase